MVFERVTLACQTCCVPGKLGLTLYPPETQYVIFFDFSKAFDHVPHDKLIMKMRAFNINPIVICCIFNFLSDRTYQVAIHGTLSDHCPVYVSVPQQSALSPLLFCIFINNLPGSLNRIIYCSQTI